MNVNAISNQRNLLQTQMQNGISTNDQLKSLGVALQNGGLAAAQQMYATLQSQGMGQNMTSQTSAIDKDFAALGKALDSGDLASAKAAYSTLKTDFQTAFQAARAQYALAKASGSLASLSTASGTTTSSLSGISSSAALVK